MLLFFLLTHFLGKPGFAALINSDISGVGCRQLSYSLQSFQGDLYKLKYLTSYGACIGVQYSFDDSSQYKPEEIAVAQGVFSKNMERSIGDLERAGVLTGRQAYDPVLVLHPERVSDFLLEQKKSRGKYLPLTFPINKMSVCLNLDQVVSQLTRLRRQLEKSEARYLGLRRTHCIPLNNSAHTVTVSCGEGRCDAHACGQDTRVEVPWSLTIDDYLGSLKPPERTEPVDLVIAQYDDVEARLKRAIFFKGYLDKLSGCKTFSEESAYPNTACAEALGRIIQEFPFLKPLLISGQFSEASQALEKLQTYLKEQKQKLSKQVVDALVKLGGKESKTLSVLESAKEDLSQFEEELARECGPRAGELDEIATRSLIAGCSLGLPRVPVTRL